MCKCGWRRVAASLALEEREKRTFYTYGRINSQIQALVERERERERSLCVCQPNIIANKFPRVKLRLERADFMRGKIKQKKKSIILYTSHSFFFFFLLLVKFGIYIVYECTPRDTGFPKILALLFTSSSSLSFTPPCTWYYIYCSSSPLPCLHVYVSRFDLLLPMVSLPVNVYRIKSEIHVYSRMSYPRPKALVDEQKFKVRTAMSVYKCTYIHLVIKRLRYYRSTHKARVYNVYT